MRAAQTATRATAAPEGTLLVQRCSCGSQGQSASGMCEECQEKEALGLQPKLIVGASDDPYEREADRAAAAVTADRAASVAGGGPVATVRRRTGPAGAGAGQAAPPSVSRAISRTGEPLPRSARGYFEPLFGHDFGNVRVHRDTEAAASARDVAARAYTVGHHVVFGAGRYAPESRGGRSLIAHELAHVIQQTGTVQRATLGPQPEVRGAEAEDEEEELRQEPGEEETQETEAPPTETVSEEPEEEDADAGASVLQRQPLGGDEFGDPWPEKTEAAAVRAEMEASQKCVEQTPADPAECEPSKPLTWDDFKKKPPKSKFAAATFSKLVKRPMNTQLLKCMPKAAAAQTAGSQGLQAVFVPGRSWVMKIYKDPDNPKLQPCKKHVGKCKKLFKKSKNRTTFMTPGGCEASPAPRGDVASSAAECDTVLAQDCADMIKADSPRLLAHEQGHFDLTCAMARKANALITKGTNVNRLLKSATKILKKQQKKYDKETKHGCVPDKQSEWETAIASGLPDVELKAK